MAATDIWGSFTEDERKLLRWALHQPIKRLRVDESRLVRRYWARMKSRSTHRTADQKDARRRPEYHAWLEANGLPTTPFNQRHYGAWQRGCDRWTL